MNLLWIIFIYKKWSKCLQTASLKICWGQCIRCIWIVVLPFAVEPPCQMIRFSFFLRCISLSSNCIALHCIALRYIELHWIGRTSDNSDGQLTKRRASVSADAKSKCPRSAPLGQMHSRSHFHTISREEVFERKHSASIGLPSPIVSCSECQDCHFFATKLLHPRFSHTVHLSINSVRQITFTKRSFVKHNPKSHLPQSFTTWTMLMCLTKQSVSGSQPAHKILILQILLSVCPEWWGQTCN